MKWSLNLEGINLAAIVMIIITSIATIISAADIPYFNNPHLVYNIDKYQYINDNFDSMVHICVWNEGYTKADNITIYLQTNGKIGANNTYKGYIGSDGFPEPELRIEVIDGDYYILNIPCIVPDTKYDVRLVVSCMGNNPIDHIMIESENGGIARENSKNILYRNIRYSLPFLALIMILIIIIRR